MGFRMPENSIPSLGDYIRMQKELQEKVPAGALDISGMSEKEKMSSGIFQPQSYSDPSKQMENEIAIMKAKAGEGGPQMSFADPVAEAERSGMQESLKSGAESIGKPAAPESEGSIGGDIGGAAIAAGASALKGILKAKAEKEAIEFQKKREMTESQSKAQQKTAARGMGAGVQNMQQLIANFRASAK